MVSKSIELVEVYRYEGFVGRRYRFRIKGSKVYINVLANSLEEAVEKVKQIIDKLELDKHLFQQPESGGEKGNAKE